jgi:hypothetical protein
MFKDISNAVCCYVGGKSCDYRVTVWYRDGMRILWQPTLRCTRSVSRDSGRCSVCCYSILSWDVHWIWFWYVEVNITDLTEALTMFKKKLLAMISSTHKRASGVTKTSAARETARPTGQVVHIRSLDVRYVMPCWHIKIVSCLEMVVMGFFEKPWCLRSSLHSVMTQKTIVLITVVVGREICDINLLAA